MLSYVTLLIEMVTGVAVYWAACYLADFLWRQLSARVRDGLYHHAKQLPRYVFTAVLSAVLAVALGILCWDGLGQLLGHAGGGPRARWASGVLLSFLAFAWIHFWTAPAPLRKHVERGRQLKSSPERAGKGGLPRATESAPAPRGRTIRTYSEPKEL